MNDPPLSMSVRAPSDRRSRVTAVPNRAVAEEFVAELASAYGRRLSRVLLFGSVARGQADEESDVDLLVVLDRIDDRWAESQRLSDLGWEFLARTGHAAQAIPVTEEELATSDKPVLIRARQEGVVIR